MHNNKRQGVFLKMSSHIPSNIIEIAKDWDFIQITTLCTFAEQDGTDFFTCKLISNAQDRLIYVYYPTVFKPLEKRTLTLICHVYV